MKVLTIARIGTGILVGMASGAGSAAAESAPTPAVLAVMTVTGPVPIEDLGLVLAHEHVMSTFGAEPAAMPQYDDAAVMTVVSPSLIALREAGVGAVVEATAAYFGRDPRLLRQISERTGVKLITNTGYYGAANGRYLPPDLLSLSPDAIAARWNAEATEGIGGTGIRPGFIKLGVNAGPLSEADRLLLRAAARTHRATGLSIAVHTGANRGAATEQLDLLAAEGVRPDAWVWVHAHQAPDAADLVAAARRGAWVSVDGWNAATAARSLELLRELRAAGLLHRVLLSHDGNLHPAPGARPRPLDWLLREGRAAFTAAGFSPAEWRLLTTENPAAAYAIRVRTL